MKKLYLLFLIRSVSKSMQKYESAHGHTVLKDLYKKFRKMSNA